MFDYRNRANLKTRDLKNLYGNRAWLVPVFILLVALAATLAIGALHHKAHNKNDAQLLLAHVENDAVEQQLIEDEAIADRRITPELLTEVRDKRDEIKKSMDGLRRLDPDNGSLAKVRSSLNDYETALDEELRFVRSGDIDRADSVDEERVDPGFDELHEVLEVASEEYAAEVDRARAIAEVGTYAVGLGSALFTAFLFLVYLRSNVRGRQALEASEERYEIAIRGANDGIWDWNVLSDRTYFSPKWKEMLGYRDDEFDNLFEEWRKRIHPEDLAFVESTLRSYLEGDSSHYEIEHRLQHKDGGYRWILTRGACVRGEDGKPLRMAGSHTDVTERKQAEEKLQEAEERYRLLVENVPVVVYVDSVNETNSAVYRSPYVEQMLGYAPEEFLSSPDFWHDVLHPEDRERVQRENERTNETGEPFKIEYRMISKDGREVWVRDEAVLIHDKSGKPRLWQGVFMDITERKSAEGKLQETETRYRTLVEQIPAVTYIQEIGHSDTAEYVSPQIEAITGYSPEEFKDSPTLWYDVVHSEDRERVKAEDERTDLDGETFEMEYRMIHRDGREVWVRDEAVLVRDDAGELLFWQGVMFDITDRKALEAQLTHEALHDPLTGLPNRVLLLERLNHSLARSGRRKTSVAVAFVDFDNFKVVNDSLGHERGDQLLLEASERISSCVRVEDTVARFGGDEFIVLLENDGSINDAVHGIDRISTAFEEPFVIAGQRVHMSISVGIAFSGWDDVEADDLLRDADAAMYVAKEKGKNQYQIFDPSMAYDAQKRLSLENDLRLAIHREEFRVVYQPKVLLGSGSVVGFEALVRWDHPERGLVPPLDFIPLAEETGMILPIGNWVLREACRQVMEWHESLCMSQPMTPLAISVNLSAKQFQQKNLAQDVSCILEETGLSPSSLILEITESVVMDDAPLTTTIMAELKALGVRLSIDDFGTGYSSFSYLKRFPADYLKIDCSFVDSLGRDVESAAIVSSMVNLAQDLGMKAVAEGIETTDQLERLKIMGCELG